MEALASAVVFLALVAAPASADTQGGPGTFVEASGRPPLDAMTLADDPRARGLQGAALEYWRAQGFASCPLGIEAWYASMRLLGLAGGGGCWAILSHGSVADLRDTRTRSERRYLAAIECNRWAHEFGHALGLTHDDAGRYRVMAIGVGADATPQCAHRARTMYPPRQARSRGPRPKACVPSR